jgi:hypothetical protein
MLPRQSPPKPPFLRLRAVAGLAFALLLGLAGCSTRRPPPVAASTPPPESLHGTVLLIRPAGATSGIDRRTETAVLAAIGGPSAPTPDAGEILVRTDGGQVLSVVVPATTGLRPGAPVVLLLGQHLQLAGS